MSAQADLIEQEVLPELSAIEASRLVDLETAIDANMVTFVAVGEALREIRDSRLYRAEHKTFEAYVARRFDLSRRYAYDLIASADVVTVLCANGAQISPVNERVMRELLPLREDPDQLRVVWSQAVEQGKPTAASVRKLVRPIVDPPSEVTDEQVSAVREALKHLDELRQLAANGTPVIERGDIAISYVDLQAALDKLPERRRMAVQLALVEDQRQEDVAEQMGIRTPTVSQYVDEAVLQVTKVYFGHPTPDKDADVDAFVTALKDMAWLSDRSGLWEQLLTDAHRERLRPYARKVGVLLGRVFPHDVDA